MINIVKDLELDKQLCFILQPNPVSRLQEIVPRDLKVSKLTLVSNNTILVSFERVVHDPIHFTSNGTVIHQSNEIVEALEGKDIVAESDMIAGIKYIAAETVS